MLEKVKWYFIDIILPKYIPIGVMAALAALGTFMAAHKVVIVLVVGAFAMAARATEHHTVGVVTGPQPEVGGSRPGDPPKEIK